MSRWIVLIVSLCLGALGVGCTSDDDNGDPIGPTGPARSFSMGFTPFPYDDGFAPQDYVYDKIASHADIVCHHFDNGIPWPEALHNDNFHVNVMGDWQNRLGRTPAGHKMLVTVTPIDIGRDTLAPYKAGLPDSPLPPPWDTYSFNHDSVKVAYVNYCERVIDFFDPDYLVIGIEVNLLIEADTTLGKWNDYLELQQHTYTALKASKPSLPVFVSFTAMDLIDGYTDAHHSLQSAGFAQAMQYSDYCGLSFHPVISVFQADSLPQQVIHDVLHLSNKPVVITETSYPAEDFSILGGSIQFHGTPAKQEQFFADLFATADSVDVGFIINFVIRDYDALWADLGSPDDIAKLWRDTGLWDEDGNERPVVTVWNEWLGRREDQ
ncbi:hypothetical protein GF377_02380 [candidate division GN15 bacterium]|nr:hypothetical protein [candidate division GN15 bacterium]